MRAVTQPQSDCRLPVRGGHVLQGKGLEEQVEAPFDVATDITDRFSITLRQVFVIKNFFRGDKVLGVLGRITATARGRQQVHRRRHGMQSTLPQLSPGVQTTSFASLAGPLCNATATLVSGPDFL